MPPYRIPHALRALIAAGLLAACAPATPTAPAAIANGTPTLPPTPTAQPTPTPTSAPPFQPPLPSPADSLGLPIPDGAKTVLGLSPVWNAGISPDRSRMAIQTSLGIAVVDTATLQPVWKIPFPGWASARWSHDGSKIMFITYHTIIVRDAHTGDLINQLAYHAVFPVSDREYVPIWNTGVWSPDDKLLALSGQEIILWDYAANRIALRIPKEARDFHWLPDGKRIATEIGADTVITYDTTTGEPIHTFDGSWEAWSPVKGLLVTRTYKAGVDSNTVWDIDTGDKLWSYALWSELSPDRSKVATGNDDGTIDVFPFGRSAPSGPLYTLNANSAKDVIFGIWSNDSSILVTASGGKTTLWDASSGAPVCTIDTGEVYAVWFPDNQRFISVGNGAYEMTIRDRGCGRIGSMPKFSWYGPEMVFLNGGQQVLELAHDGYPDDGFSVVDMASGSLTHQLTGSGAKKVGWTSDSGHVVATFEGINQTSRVISWDLETGQAALAPDTQVIYPQEHEFSAKAPLVHSPDGDLSFRWGSDDMLQMIDIKTGEAIRRLSAHNAMEEWRSTITWSPDGRLAVVHPYESRGPQDDNIYIFNARSWQLMATYRGNALAFSPDNRWIAVATADNLVVVWPAPQAR